MRAAALILAVLLTAVPVTDTGTGTAVEYDTSSVTESVRATASVAPTEQTETVGGTMWASSPTEMADGGTATHPALRATSPDKGRLAGDEGDEILRFAQDETGDDTSSVTAAPCHLPLGGEGLRATASVANTAETETEDGETPHPSAALTPSPKGEGLPEQTDERGYLQFVSVREIEMLACLVDREIGAGTRIEKEAVVWCVLNRFDRGSAAGFKDSISGVLLQANQFYASYAVGSIESQNVVVDVLTLWMMERQSGYPVDGRCLPREFCWYCSDDNHRHNLFHDKYIPGIGQCGNEWDWSWTGGY